MNSIIDLSISSTCFEGVYSLDTNTTNSFPEKFRRHLFYIALPEEYLDINWDFIDGVWTKIK